MRCVAAVLVAFSVTACGNASSEPHTGSTSPEPEPAPQPSPDPTTAEPGPEDTSDDIIVEPDTAPTEDSARGAISIEIAPGCSVPSGFYDFPPGSAHPVDAENKRAGWRTGDVAPDDTSVSATCVWQPTNPPTANISISHGAFGSESSAGVNVEVDPSAIATGVLVALQTPEVPGGLGTVETSNCLATLIDFDEETRSIWGSFTCDALVAYAEGDTCAVSAGYFYFDNCRPFAPR